jgi:hypothetical protein
LVLQSEAFHPVDLILVELEGVALGPPPYGRTGVRGVESCSVTRWGTGVGDGTVWEAGVRGTDRGTSSAVGCAADGGCRCV